MFGDDRGDNGIKLFWYVVLLVYCLYFFEQEEGPLRIPIWALADQELVEVEHMKMISSSLVLPKSRGFTILHHGGSKCT